MTARPSSSTHREAPARRQATERDVFAVVSATGTDFYLSPDGFGPNNAGKWGPGFAHRTTATGNGGACGSPVIIDRGPRRAGRHATSTRRAQSRRTQSLSQADPGTYQYTTIDCQMISCTRPAPQSLTIWAAGTVIEVHMKLNSIDPTLRCRPGGRDPRGVDRRSKVFRKTDFLWRCNPPWLPASSSHEVPVFADQGSSSSGGMSISAVSGNRCRIRMHFLFKNVTISTNYVGPMRLSVDAEPRLR